MRSIGYFSAVALVSVLLTSQGFGQSSMHYSLQLGGDNYAADWKAGTRQFYAEGSSNAGQVFLKTEPINFAVVLEASGFHDQDGHPSDGYEIFGAANCVFNVELYSGSVAPENLETGATFYSTINDDTGGDPLAAAAFAVSYATKSGQKGRLIDPVLTGGPRMEPIFTYPTAQPGMLIGMGAGFKEWNKTGGDSLKTIPGVAMDVMPNGTGGHIPGLGVKPIAEGQIDMSGLPNGTYVLKVVPGNGNNVLRGDLNMVAATNRPAFAVAANSATGTELTFEINDTGPCVGIQGRYVFYNNSAWDTVSDDDAIAPDKQALLYGETSTSANYITYSKGLNGIMIDMCSIVGVPTWDGDIIMRMGNTNQPFTYTDIPPQPNFTVRNGEGVNGSDRLVITWPDNALPSKTWLVVGIYPGAAFDIPDADYFAFGVCVGDANGDGTVNATDQLEVRNNPSGFWPTVIDNPYDHNRDKAVNATDELISRNNPTGFYPLVMFTWN